MSYRRSAPGLLVLLIALSSDCLAKVPSQFVKVVFHGTTGDLGEFDQFAQRAKASGATHIEVTGMPYPFSYWQFDTPGDPYPAWAISHFTLFKVATPDALKPYIPQDYAEKVMKLLEDRCKVLRKHGLKAYVRADEPHISINGTRATLRRLAFALAGALR